MSGHSPAGYPDRWWRPACAPRSPASADLPTFAPAIACPAGALARTAGKSPLAVVLPTSSACSRLLDFGHLPARPPGHAMIGTMPVQSHSPEQSLHSALLGIASRLALISSAHP